VYGYLAPPTIQTASVLGVGLAQRRLRRHRDLPPLARTALADTVGKLAFGIGLPGVLLGNFLVGRPEHLAINRMAAMRAFFCASWMLAAALPAAADDRII
jgi:hypothetical protein